MVYVVTLTHFVTHEACLMWQSTSTTFYLKTDHSVYSSAIQKKMST